MEKAARIYVNAYKQAAFFRIMSKKVFSSQNSIAEYPAGDQICFLFMKGGARNEQDDRPDGSAVRLADGFASLHKACPCGNVDLPVCLRKISGCGSQ